MIIAVAQDEDCILIRVIRSERTQDGARPVLFRIEHDMNDLEDAKIVARQEAEKLLGRKVPADLEWKE